jgi:hypothetical protein
MTGALDVPLDEAVDNLKYQFTKEGLTIEEVELIHREATFYIE